jgi:hypothetical protein
VNPAMRVWSVVIAKLRQRDISTFTKLTVRLFCIESPFDGSPIKGAPSGLEILLLCPLIDLPVNTARFETRVYCEMASVLCYSSYSEGIDRTASDVPRIYIVSS